MSAIDLAKPGGLDQKILEDASTGFSPEEISARIGGVLNAPKVAIRIKQLIASPDDYLTLPEQTRLNLRMMRSTLSELRTRYTDLDNAKVQLTYMKEIGATLERLQKTNEQDINTYNTTVGRAMGRIYDMALAHIGGALRERVAPEEWAQLKREALELAQAEVARSQIES